MREISDGNINLFNINISCDLDKEDKKIEYLIYLKYKFYKLSVFKIDKFMGSFENNEVIKKQLKLKTNKIPKLTEYLNGDIDKCTGENLFSEGDLVLYNGKICKIYEVYNTGIKPDWYDDDRNKIDWYNAYQIQTLDEILSKSSKYK